MAETRSPTDLYESRPLDQINLFHLSSERNAGKSTILSINK